MLEMNEMLKLVVEREGSDLHISVGKPPVMRLHGGLDIVDPDVITPEDSDRLMREITPPRYQQQIQETGVAVVAYALSDMAPIRGSAMLERGNSSICEVIMPSRR